MPPGKMPGKIPGLKMPGSKASGKVSKTSKAKPAAPKLPSKDLFPQHADKTSKAKSAVGKTAGKAADRIPGLKQLRSAGKIAGKAKGALQSAKQKGIGKALGDWGKAKFKGGVKAIGKLAKKGIKMAGKAAAKAAKHAIKKGAMACVASGICLAVVGAVLLVGLLVVVVILAFGGYDEENIGEMGNNTNSVSSEFEGAVSAGYVYSGNNYVRWSKVAEILGNDGRVVTSSTLSASLVDWWANGGRSRLESVENNVEIFSHGYARVLSEEPCRQAAELALALRRQWENLDEGRTKLESGFGGDDAEHYLFPRWSPELETWLDSPDDETPPQPSSSQDSLAARNWEARRLATCHSAAATLGPLASLVEWETQMGDDLSLPSGSGNGVRAYVRMIQNSKSGYTKSGLRLLMLWLSSKENWRHLYATQTKPTTDNPSGIVPCDIGDQLENWDAEMDGRTAIFHSCPPKAPDYTICTSTEHLQSTLIDSEQEQDGHEAHEAPPPIDGEEPIFNTTIPACSILLIASTCNWGNDAMADICAENIAVLQAQIAALVEAARAEEDRLLADLESRNETPPLLGGLLYQARIPKSEAILVIGAALEELGGDVALFDESLNTQVAHILYALECPSGRDNTAILYCTAGTPTTVEELLARKNSEFITAWSDGDYGKPEGTWDSATWDTESERWLLTQGEYTLARDSVECPWLARWHLADQQGRCWQASDESADLLAAFGYSPINISVCPTVVWNDNGVMFAGTGLSAAIDDENDPRLGEIVSAGETIKIHVCLVKPVSELLVWAGRAMDPPLAISSAWRSTSHQVELRSQNCGGDANVYNPDAVCDPATARPGFSMHNAGLAIDFANCQTKGSVCYNWLNANMPAGFLINLQTADEAWHWSTNGQ